MKIRSALALFLVMTNFLMLLPHLPARAAAAQDEADEETAEPGLRFRLSEGERAGPRPTPTPVAVAPSSPLPEDETRRLLARLPPIKEEAGDAADFRLRENSLPPPRAGQTLRSAFAPPDEGPSPPKPTTKAVLEVLRYAPVGEVELAPSLNVTFSQPMVAVSSQSEAAASVPVKLTPQPAGEWRWVGSQTLVFQPTAEGGRFPMATEYVVTVPAGIRSALGNAVAGGTTFKFATPAPTLKRSYPSGTGQPRDALLFLEFDQRVSADEILGHLRLEPASGARLRLATKDEIAADKTVAELAKNSAEGRWLAVRAVNGDGTTKDALPSDASVRVVVPAGTPSAEGPRVTAKEQSFTFRTYGPLLVTEAACGYGGRCSPADQFRLVFSNQLDPKTVSAASVKVTPQFLDLPLISASYAQIFVTGEKKGNATYTVRLDRSVRDVYGQALSGKNEFTFKVNPHEPALFSGDEGFVVLDPAGARSYVVYSVNYKQLRVRLYRVAAEDWAAFRNYQRVRYGRSVGERASRAVTPPGRLVSESVVDVKGETDAYTATAVDLSPALTNNFGQVFVQVEPVEEADAPVRVRAFRPDGRVESWVQVTNIGLDAFADRTSLVAWANSLSDGSPLPGVRLSVLPEGVSGVTGADGIARLPLKSPPANTDGSAAVIIARRGDDSAILPQSFHPHYWGNSGGWRRASADHTFRWYVFDDRRLYRPGEEVSVKGWIRKVNLTPTGDTELFAAGGRTVNYVLVDSQDNEITKGSARLNALAGFDFRVTLPPTMNLGASELKLELDKDDDAHVHRFQVQEFRRPEFEIKASISDAPHFVGESATVTATASYYSGGGLPNTKVDWHVAAIPTNYVPPNRADYVFGKFIPWWTDADDDGETTDDSFEGRTDAEGKHALRIDFDGVTPPRPSSVMVEARIQDVNRQTLAAHSTLLVHPARVYVGLKSTRTFVKKGEQFDVSTIVTDLDGRALPGRDVSLRLVRLEWVFEEGAWKRKESDAEERTVKSGADAVRIRFPAPEGGEYRLTARVRDERERPNETELSLWAAGGKTPPKREVEQESVELVPDRRTYASGDVAEILIQSPFAPAEGVMTLRRSGLLKTVRFSMNESSHVLRVPMEEAMTPNVHVQVDLVGAAVRTDERGEARPKLPKRPAYASGEIKLEVPPSSRRLNVRAKPRDEVLEPGKETVVDVEVRDAAGRPVGGTDTAVVVVDESILALTNFKLEDPLSYFHPGRDEDVNDYHLRERVKLEDTEALEIRMGGGSGGGGAGTAGRLQAGSEGFAKDLPVNARMVDEVAMLAPGMATETVTVTAGADTHELDPQSLVNLRRNFNALAVFAASLPTDASGRAQVKVKLPDNLTRYRAYAVSVAGGRHAGTGESSITARLPLMARPSAPRFLNYGDRAELPVVVQNQTGSPLSVAVAVRATNAELTDGAGRRVNVPANDRVEVRFPVAAVRPGVARFQVAASAGASADAAEVFLPVYTPATTEAFATYGVLDEGAVAQPVRAPAGAIKNFGGLEVTTASTQLQELTDAFIYLYNYPFECSEQMASRVISVVALKDVLAAFDTRDLPSPEAIRESVGRDLKRLESLQNDDGGFGFWRRGEESFPFVSVHVAHAFARARRANFPVAEESFNEARDYLRGIEPRIPESYGREARFAILSYALYVRALMNDRDAAGARKVVASAGGVEKLSLESLGWLLPALSGDAGSAKEVEAIRRHLNNRVTETAGAAHFADSYEDGEYTVLQSDRRADGVLLEALIGDQPRSDLIPKLVRGLLGHRKRGRWSNTQENVFVLLGLERYFQTYEKQTPDFVARIWLGSDFAGERAFKGRTTDRQQLELPMQALAERTASAPTDLIIGKEGAGRLYFRVGARYAPSDLKLAPADYGFKVERSYEAVDDPGDVRRDADGTWQVKAGARVRVRVRLFAPARRYHVALVDPLPAGLEALNPELATTERLPEGSSESVVVRSGRGILDHYFYWRGPWYEHQNVRDERVEAFTKLLWEGAHEYSYFARATTPGTYVVPPAKAEEMYSPETFGRGQTDRVRVE